MILAGLQKNSMIDFPGKLSCVVFLTGCNFSCAYCHNPDLARGIYPQSMTMDELSAFLNERRHFLEGVVITGGEPTLWPQLPDLCRVIREQGLAVKLDTNGSRPAMLMDLIESGQLDYIAMDIKTVPDRYAPAFCDHQNAAGICQSIDIIKNCSLDYEFRTTCAKPLINESIIEQIALRIQGARRFNLQNFHSANILAPHCLDDHPGFTPEQMERLCTVAARWVACCSIR